MVLQMKVPRAVQVVFDEFPLKYYAAQAVSQDSDCSLTLYVPSLDEHEEPRDPYSIIAHTLLKRTGVDFHTKVGSPYMSPKNTLPLLLFNDSDRALAGRELVDYLINKNGSLEQSRDNVLYRHLVDVPLNDAWLATVLLPANDHVCRKIYQSARDRQRVWPASYFIDEQLRDYLHSGLSYTATPEPNLPLIELTVLSLGAYLDTRTHGEKSPNIIDYMVYAFGKSVKSYVPNSYLAQMLDRVNVSKHLQWVESFV